MLLRGYNRVLHTQLCLPRLSSTSRKGMVNELKKALSAPIEGKACCWTSQMNRMSKFQRMSVAMSLFLFRKVLPAEQPSIEEFVERVQIPSPEPDADFLEFAGGLVDKIFEKGWDAKYSSYVDTGSIGTSSCEEGGCSRRVYMEEHGEDARGLYGRVCKGSQPDYELARHSARMKNVFTAGKYRTISIPCIDHHHLRPLHRLFYDHLSRQGWLLRGDAVSERFEKKSSMFCRVPGEVFVSGDYEGATDNLNNHVQRFLLDRVLKRCQTVPESIRAYALDSLSPLLSWEGGQVELRRGQMMGFLLSFPLLCLVNYVTFKFFVRRKVPIKVNGDDIVFRARLEEASAWASGVQRAGLKLSLGKTMVSRSFFSLNSTLFKSKKNSEGVAQVPFIRAKALFGVEDGKNSPFFSLRGRLQSFCVGFRGPARDVWMELFLKCNRGFIKRTKCSISRGLGVPLAKHVLQSANLWDRECAYLSLPREKPPPVPLDVWSSPPEGFELAWADEKKIYTKTEKEELRNAFADAAWKAPREASDYEDAIVGLSMPSINSKKFARLAKATFSDIRLLLSSNRDKVYASYLASRVKKYQYWKKREGPGTVRTRFESNQEENHIGGILYPPPAILYGMAAAEGYKPSSLRASLSERRADVVPFASCVTVRDRFGFTCSDHEYDDVYLMWE